MHKMLSHLFFLFSISTAMLTISASNTASTTPEDEISALQSLKKSLIDPMDILKDWNFPPNSQHCNWTGILCNSNGRIQTLDLSNMNLSGTIPQQIHLLTSLTSLNFSSNYLESSLPTSLSNLTSLISIDVSLNNFAGQFPTGIGKFKRLIYLNASSNNFAGALPVDLSSAISLETLDFRGSFFEGPIPTSFQRLKSLKFLGLSGNNLTGRLPPALGQLSSLETLILGYNEFDGPIPPEIGNLSKLQYLDLAVGSLSGEIPVELANLKNLTTVYLYKNEFSGRIPNEIGNVSSLIYLDISDNRISGEIPRELGRLKNLQLLNLMCNQLTGSVPVELGQLPNLEILELWKNELVGSLPLSLGKNSPLQWLDVSSNKLSGEIPAGLCDSGELIKLILFNNSFSGLIPLGLSNCSSLVRVRVQNNLISGTIPPGLGTLPKLQRLELENNNLTGEIPDEFSLSTSLSFLDLSKNNLYSSLPSGILSIPTLQTFMASKNMIIGHIPNQFQDCPFLSVLDLSYNNLSGEIPESISSCEKLVSLNTRGNRLTGEIPRSIATMPTLSVLDLSNNSLTGEIPKKFGSSPALETLNLSFNKLQGPVPTTGMFITINPSDLEGNVGLCGGVLPPCEHGGVKPSRARSSHIKHIVVGFLVGISITLGIGLTLLMGRMVYVRWYLYSSTVQEWFKKKNNEWPWRLVAFQRLNFTSINILACIKESNVIGMGGSGIVYKAEIQRPHNVVAVKKLWRSSNRGDEQEEDLFGEVNLLGRLRHRNIVRILGYLHNETDAMMVYEFVPNGNLWSALHVKEAGQCAVLVDWVSRYNVAVGVAHGLAYLHHDCRPPVIHRDIKSNNILLDANFEAKIADFGLATSMVQKNKTISMVAGSYGYIAPEYGYTMKVDEKSDIYSYGVVLLELITGKKALDPSFGESVDIVEWVREKIRGSNGLEETLDMSVAGQCKHVQEEMLLALRIALLCTAKLPKDRPSARDILVMLQEAKPRRKSVCDKESNSYKVNIVEKPVFTATASPASDIV